MSSLQALKTVVVGILKLPVHNPVEAASDNCKAFAFTGMVSVLPALTVALAPKELMAKVPVDATVIAVSAKVAGWHRTKRRGRRGVKR